MLCFVFCEFVEILLNVLSEQRDIHFLIPLAFDLEPTRSGLLEFSRPTNDQEDFLICEDKECRLRLQVFDFLVQCI